MILRIADCNCGDYSSTSWWWWRASFYLGLFILLVIAVVFCIDVVLGLPWNGCLTLLSAYSIGPLW